MSRTYGCGHFFGRTNEEYYGLNTEEKKRFIDWKYFHKTEKCWECFKKSGYR
jgi:hypothetical protein